MEARGPRHNALGTRDVQEHALRSALSAHDIIDRWKVVDTESAAVLVGIWLAAAYRGFAQERSRGRPAPRARQLWPRVDRHNQHWPFIPETKRGMRRCKTSTALAGPKRPRADLLPTAFRQVRQKPALILSRSRNVCQEREHQLTDVRDALLKMRDGPSKSACRSRLQTATSCVGKEPSW